MKKMNYVVSLFMAFSATSTAFAATEFSDQIKKLTNEIVKSKEGASLLETAQQLRLKKGLGVMTRSDFKKLISGALLERSQEDLSKDTDKIREDLILYIRESMGANETDDLEIMAREDAIRTNEHGKKRVRKAKEAGEVVKLEEGVNFEGSKNPQPVDGAGAPGNSDQENNNNSQPEVPSKPSNNSDQENNNNPQPTDSVGSPNNSDQENNNKKSAFTPLSEDAKDRSDTKKHVTRQSKGKTNAAKEPSFFTSKREETVILKGDSSKKGKNAEDSKPSKNNGSSDSNTRKSERTRKTNPKYSSD